jgi:hypothetical protein
VVEVDPEERAREMPWIEMRVDSLKRVLSLFVTFSVMISKNRAYFESYIFASMHFPPLTLDKLAITTLQPALDCSC